VAGGAPRRRRASSWDEPGLHEAEKIPGDGHWTVAGCERIAALAAPLVRRQLAAAPPRQ
jgi:hypothetical protein